MLITSRKYFHRHIWWCLTKQLGTVSSPSWGTNFIITHHTAPLPGTCPPALTDGRVTIRKLLQEASSAPSPFARPQLFCLIAPLIVPLLPCPSSKHMFASAHSLSPAHRLPAPSGRTTGALATTTGLPWPMRTSGHARKRLAFSQWMCPSQARAQGREGDWISHHCLEALRQASACTARQDGRQHLQQKTE